MATAAVHRLSHGEPFRCDLIPLILFPFLTLMPRFTALTLASLAAVETASLAIPIPAPAGAVALLAPGCWLIRAGIDAWRSVRRTLAAPCCADCAAERWARPGPDGEDADIAAGWALFESERVAANNP